MNFLNIFTKVANAQKKSQIDGKVAFNNPIGTSGIHDIPSLIAAILEFVTKVGAAIVVFMVIYSGFLFVKAQGDPEKLKTAKSVFMWTLIGGIILLGASTLAYIIRDTATGLGAGIVD